MQWPTELGNIEKGYLINVNLGTVGRGRLGLEHAEMGKLASPTLVGGGGMASLARLAS